ncbi:hypothetical protein P5P86_16815 [Nocardioides sp. BP30]|uniref:hypothetical protein n=1 Tax=Nocardioides sp. BP30 TaxID=3036374 RepID=UPI0024697DBD|nr:hypothetical protein [Nocardioides sp. BP30]WGL51611.1 hypothetical protein P5P86_16815 [Nocardioides sp. BP30]
MAAADPWIAVPRRGQRRSWLVATLALTLLPIAVAVALAPSAGTRPGPALVWLLFVGSSAHVGATAWFYTVPEVRTHMRAHRLRYVWAPLLLVAVAAVAVIAAPAALLVEALLGFFAWQFFHFQKQNLGIAALAARATRVRALSRIERHALIWSGVGGITALIAHPTLLDLSPRVSLTWLFHGGETLFVVAAAAGALAMAGRRRSERHRAFVAVYMASLLFFVPVFLFPSPYAAVAGITMAHGMQYLLLVGLLSAAPIDASASPQLGVLVMVNIALIAGLALSQASHLHTAHGAVRGLYGCYLGLVMAHFVIDAGLWRLRDEFPRSFLSRRLPYLLRPSA